MKKRIDDSMDVLKKTVPADLSEEDRDSAEDESPDERDDAQTAGEKGPDGAEKPAEKKSDAAASPEKPGKKSGKNGKYSVTVYLCFLFAAVLLLILVSYFIQQRNNVRTINSLTESHNEFSSQAMENIQKLQEENEGYLQQISQLQTQINELQSDKSDDEDKITELQKQIKTLTTESEKNKGRSDALAALFVMEKAVNDGDNTTAAAEMAVIEPLKQYLSTDELTTYQELQKKMG